MAVLAHADSWDVALMVLGLMGAVGDGMAMPVVRLLLYTRIANDIGQGSDLVHKFTSKINVVRTYVRTRVHRLNPPANHQSRSSNY